VIVVTKGVANEAESAAITGMESSRNHKFRITVLKSAPAAMELQRFRNPKRSSFSLLCLHVFANRAHL
jgi:hypothetical protein